MRNAVFLGLVISLILLSGCPQPPTPPSELPADFHFSYGSGAMHLDWGAYYLDVDTVGNATFIKTQGMSLQKAYSFTLTEEEMLSVYSAAVVNNFFSLQDTYQDSSIIDGGWDEISLHANSSTKTVSMLNSSMPQFSAVEAAISSIISSHVGDPYSFDDLKDECDNVKKLCEGKETVDCEDAGLICGTLNPYLDCEEWGYFCDWEGDTTELDLTPEYCDYLQNREECVNYCSENFCSEELCETLLFGAQGCTECGPGCCSFCNNLDTCLYSSGCGIVWIHPEGESWQYSACENANLCADEEAICNDLSLSYQGYRYHSNIEEDSEKAAIYSDFSDVLQELYNQECE